MGKGNRTQKASEFEQSVFAQKAALQKKQKSKQRLTFIIVFVCIIAVFTVSIGGTVYIKNLKENGYLAKREKAIYTENYTFTTAMMQYLFNTLINQYTANYSDYLDQLGLDTSEDLKLQDCPYSEDQKNNSWYDYFMSNAKTQAQEMLSLCEAAKKDGITLDKTDKRYIALIKDSMQKNADYAGISVKEFLETTYGKWVDEEVLDQCLQITQLASKYQLKFTNAQTFTQDQISDYYEQNKSNFLTCDYISYLITYTGKKDKAAAKKTAQKIIAGNSVTDFKNSLESYISSSLKKQGTSGSELQEAVEQELTNAEVTEESYDTSTKAGKWLFAGNRKAGDKTIIESDSGYYVYYLTSPAAKDTTQTVNARHILFIFEDNDSDGNEDNIGKAEKKAKTVLKEWRNGKKTEQSFSAFAKKYSEDTSSLLNGGLYTNIKKGEMATEFDSWVFNQNRKTGDVDIITTDYGCHLMYYVSKGIQSWQQDVTDALKTDAYNNKISTLNKKYTATIKDGNIEDVTQILTEKQNSEQE